MWSGQQRRVKPSTDDRTSPAKEDKEFMMVTRGGDVGPDSLLDHTGVSIPEHFDGRKKTHSAGPITSGVGCGDSTPKRKYFELSYYDFYHAVLPTRSGDIGVSESPSKRCRFANCSTGR